MDQNTELPLNGQRDEKRIGTQLGGQRNGNQTGAQLDKRTDGNQTVAQLGESQAAAREKKPLLQVRDLTKRFPLSKKRTLTAVNQVSFDVYEGEKFGVVGESGCGKSTLGRVLLQLYEASSGSVMYYGKAIQELNPRYIVDELHRLGEYQKKAAAKFQEAKGLLEEAERAGSGSQQEAWKAKAAALCREGAEALLRGAVFVGDLILCKDIDRIAALLLQAEAEVREAAKAQSSYDELNRSYTWNELTLKHMEEYPREIAALEAKPALTPEERERLAQMKRIEQVNAKENPERMRSQNEVFRQQMDSHAEEKKKHQAAEAKLRAEIQSFRKGECLELPEMEELAHLREELASRYATGLDLCRLTPREMRSIRYDLQMIFQDPAASLDPRETVGKAIEETLQLNTKLPPNARWEITMQLLERVGLKREHYFAYPHNLSGGQKQRVGIARAIAVHPSFIVLDEAVSALDVSVKAQILQLLNELSDSEHLTYFFITHDLGVAKHFCDRIMVLYLGSICELAPSKELFRKRLHPYTESLLASVPRLRHGAERKQMEPLEGEVPSPINPPAGCPFHTRCKKCMDICRNERPVCREVEPGHFVACHLYDKKEEVLS